MRIQCGVHINKGISKSQKKIQKRATKLVINFKKFPYKDILMHLQLPTLKYRRLRGDMIEVLKGTLRRRLSHGYFSFIAKYTSN